MFDNGFECVRTTCESSPVFEHATRSDDAVDFGAVVTYHCESGYSVDGTVL